jgi:hypothetical protein
VIGPKRQLGAIEHDFVRGHRLASLASPGWSALSKPKLPGPNNLELDHPTKAGKANAKENHTWASLLGATSREPPACLGYIPSPRETRGVPVAQSSLLWPWCSGTRTFTVRHSCNMQGRLTSGVGGWGQKYRMLPLCQGLTWGKEATKVISTLLGPRKATQPMIFKPM